MPGAAVDGLDPAVRRVLAAAEEEAGTRGEAVWVVGGLVRDLLLGRATRDVDLAVVGDGPGWAARLGARLGVEVVRHAEFETAALSWAGVDVDVVSARRETYPSPAALPRVERGGLDDDLRRRDFTVNAMAIPLHGFPEGRLVDPMDGRGDVERRLLRVHHARSFVDDPTRILRGVALEARLGFRLEAGTERLARAAVAAGGLAALSGGRLRQAWRRAFAEGGAAGDVAARLEGLGALTALGLTPGGHATTREIGERIESARGRAAAARVDLPAVGDLMLWGLTDEPEEAPRVAARFGLTGGAAARLTGWPERAGTAERALAGRAAPETAEEAVAGLSDGELLALAARLPAEASAAAMDVLLRQRPFRLAISGEDLVRRGVREGPAVGRALAVTRRARLDGRLTRGEELEHALRVARRGRREEA